MMRASRRAQIEARPDEHPYVVTRSGMAGLQRYAQTWTGDNRTEWKTLRYNARMAIGLALSGVSNSGHDVGGFAGPAPDAELLVRWVQAGVLMPRFSIHSWNDDRTVNEPWMYAEALPAIQAMLRLRQRLVPFFYDLLLRYHADYAPMVLPTWAVFPNDPHCWEEIDEHLLGPNLLAAPVMEAGATERRLYLPDGADWTHVWTGKTFDGGAQVTVPAPLDSPPPLFARAGSAMLVDLAEGGWRPAPMQRGLWLFPPRDGDFRCDVLDVAGDGHGAPMHWQMEGTATHAQVRVRVTQVGPRGAEDSLPVLLPDGDPRELVVEA